MATTKPAAKNLTPKQDADGWGELDDDDVENDDGWADKSNEKKVASSSNVEKNDDDDDDADWSSGWEQAILAFDR